MTNFETDIISNNLSITFLRHASLLIKYKGKNIYIDPVSQFDDLCIDYSTFPKADLILVTHDHFDHFSPEVIKVLAKADTKVVTNELASQQLENALVMHNGDALNFFENTLKVEAVPAYNITEGHTQFHTPARDNGYVLTFEESTIYIAGDTEDIPEMERLKVKNINIAFLPVNQPYTMTVEQVAKVAKVIKPQILYPYHFTNTDLRPLAALLADTNIELRLKNMN